MRSEVLFIGGRSGVGKSTAADALHELLKARDVRHAVIEGDALDLAHPAPHVEFPNEHLAERNLAAMWVNYRALGFRRLVYTNTVSVLERRVLAEAMGDDPRVIGALLRAGDRTTGERLRRRAVGGPVDGQVAHSARTALHLDEHAPADVHRIDTDGLAPTEIAARLLALTGWGRPVD